MDEVIEQKVVYTHPDGTVLEETPDGRFVNGEAVSEQAYEEKKVYRQQ